MGVGSKIKEYRNKSGLTQKELADELHVTYQAVSRWENDDAEPSFDMLKDICRILNCSTDELFEMGKANEDIVEPEPKIIERVIVQEQKPVLAVCHTCNNPIYESDDLHRVTEKERYRSGRTYHSRSYEIVLCNNCFERRKEQIELQSQKVKKEYDDNLKRKRIHSFVWPTIIAITLLIFAITSFVKGNNSAGIILLVFSVLSFTGLSTLILNNTFINDMWLGVASWGFVRFPGIIFSFSADGLKFLIIMKLLFFLLGIAFVLLAFALATGLALVFSVFAYPFALGKNLSGKE